MNGVATYILKTPSGFEVGTLVPVFGKAGAFSVQGVGRRVASRRETSGAAKTLEAAQEMAEGLRRSGAAAHGLTANAVAAQKTPKMNRKRRKA